MKKRQKSIKIDQKSSKWTKNEQKHQKTTDQQKYALQSFPHAAL